MSTWRIPTPHEVLALLFIIMEAAREVDYFPPSSIGARLLGLGMTVAAMTGIAAARNYISPRLREVLDERDRVTSSAMVTPVIRVEAPRP